MKDFPYLTAVEAAQVLEITVGQLRRLIREKRMPRTFLFGKQYLVHKADVAEHLKRRLERGKACLERLTKEPS